MPEREGRGQNVDIQGHSEQRSFTWQQAQLLLGYDLMGQSLARDLAQMPDLRDEVSLLVHTTTLGYEGVLRHIFFESGRDERSLITSPFVRAFETTSQCSDEEREFLTQLKNLSARTDLEIPEELAIDFQEWVDSKIPFLAKGLQRCVLDAGVIDPLTREEAQNKSLEAHRAWREAVTKGFLKPGNIFDWHFHQDTDEIFIVLKGEGKYYCEDEVTDYKKGDVITTPANLKHKIESGGVEESEYYFIRVKAK